MAKPYASTTSETVVRDPRSGRLVTIRGLGALKGQLTIDEGIDLTRPIASQVLNGSNGSTRKSSHPKP